MSNFGIARVTDPVFCDADVHGIGWSKIALPVLGRITQGSLDTLCNDRQVARLGDAGTHAACPGPQSFLIIGGAAKTFVNDRPMARETDETMHCGGFIENPGTSIGAIQDGMGSPNSFTEA
jgi:uncharacterized Zn-binding protein involved in type VI secretion